MIVDVSAFVGPYPFRGLAGTDPASLLARMDAVGIEQAWVGHLPSFLYRDPAPGNAELLDWLAPHRTRLHPVPTLHPGLPDWRRDLETARAGRAPAVRVYPNWQGVVPDGAEMRDLARAAGSARLPMILTVRLEDGRQRHPLDAAPEFPAAAVRALARAGPEVRLLVTHADRAFVEEVHFGLTAEESRRVLWDFSWIWGPPENHLALLLETVGVERFTLGTGTPLRLMDGPFAKLDLLDLTPADRERLLGANLQRWRT